jgi:type II secretory pathway pseudopilin PulG
MTTGTRINVMTILSALAAAAAVSLSYLSGTQNRMNVYIVVLLLRQQCVDSYLIAQCSIFTVKIVTHARGER